MKSLALYFSLPFLINDSYDSAFWAWTTLALNRRAAPNNTVNMYFFCIELIFIIS